MTAREPLAAPIRRGPRVSARFGLALSYAVFLVAAGGVVLGGVYVVLRTVPNYPLTAANPRDDGTAPSRQEILELLLSVSGYILVALAVIGFLGGWVLAGWVLRPLRAINATAVEVAAGDLGRRIRLRGRNDEFRQLADSFDVMLDRLEQGFAARRRFAANASHELRTPLAVMGTLLEVARRSPSTQDYPRLVARLAETNDRAVGLVGAILRLAEAEAGERHLRLVDLAEVVEEAVADLRDEADAQGVCLNVSSEPAPAAVDVAMARQALENLLQNAIRHNHRGGEIWISTRPGTAEGGAEVRVENTGEVLPEALVERLSEPFLRGHGRSTRTAAGADRQAGVRRGHGLGLALVDAVVQLHEGELVIRPRAHGGLIVSTSWPTSALTHAQPH